MRDDDLFNWDEIVCSYKRDNYDGVVRSFTTQFVFVNKAKDILLSLYLRDRHNAKASISVHTITDSWEWEEKFRCPLDFSTVEWENGSFTINAVDNSLAALIKANKGTKYELEVGTDIEHDGTLLFNRLPIQESLTYEITEGGSDSEDGSLTVPATQNNRIFCGVVNSEEIYIGGAIYWKDDQTKDAGSYMLEAHKDVDVTIDFRIESDRCYEVAGGMNVSFQIIRKGGATQSVDFRDGYSFPIGSTGKHFCGSYDSEAALKAAYPSSLINVGGSPKTNYWADVNGVVWAVIYRGSGTQWESQNVTPDAYRRAVSSGKSTVRLNNGDKIALAASGTGAHVYNSYINFSWFTKGSPCNIPVFSPQNVAETLLSRITEGSVNTRVFISDFDSRLKNTKVMAAESIRDIPGAKLYSSFTEFCDWLSAVFGYVYLIEERASEFVLHKEALGGYPTAAYPINNEPWYAHNTHEPTAEDIVYFERYGKFVAYNGAEWFGNFPGESDYNSPLTGLARTDVVFSLRRYKNGELVTQLCYFKNDNTGQFVNEPILYSGSLADIFKPYQAIRFVHRSEIFNDGPCRKIPNCTGVKYSVDSSVIYSAVTVGYDKKDYDNVNGRDEFNFNNTYSTGCTVSDKTLSLISKYRADSYGIEFAAQKRGASSTDSSSDKDVFFVLCKQGASGLLLPDMSLVVSNAMSDEVFNGAFSPMACVHANAGFIGLQADTLTLKFASSTGNSNIVIEGESMSGDIVLDTPLATSGCIEFSTDEVDDIAHVDELIEVVDDEGMVYLGYLKEVDVKYARTEASQYKLIVKQIEP